MDEAGTEVVAQNPLKLLRSPSIAALESLQRDFAHYLETPADGEALQGAIGTARQLHGVFVLLDEPQSASLMREIQLLGQRLADGFVADPESVQRMLSEAMLQAERHFNWLLRGGDQPYFDLLPLIARLRKARTGSSEAIVAVPERVNTARLALNLRPRLQRRLLALLQGRTEALRPIAGLFARLRQQAGEATLHRLWWLAEAVFEQAAAQGVIDRDLTRLLRELDQCVRQLPEGVRALAQEARVQRLLARLERHLSATEPGKKKLQEYAVYRAGIDDLRTTRAGQRLLDGSALHAVLDQLRGQLSDCQYHIEQFFRAPRRQELLRAEPQRLHDAANVLRMLNLDSMAELLRRQILFLVRWQTEDVTPNRPQEIERFARALVLVQSGLEALSEQIEGHDRVLINAEVGESSIAQSLQRLELRRAQHIIAQESADLIERAWVVATDYMDQGGAPAWDALTLILKRVVSGFAILGNTRALALVQQLDEQLAGLAQGRVHLAQPQTFIALFAEVIVSLAHLLGLLGSDTDPDDALEKAESRLQALQQWLEGAERYSPPASAEEVQPVNSTTPAAPEPPARSNSTNQPAAADTVDDDDIFEIFVEEANGEVESIAELVPAWRARLDDREILGTIRRAFHTLKGSGRMVGETDFGEFAWHFEQVLNMVLDGRLTPKAEIVDAVDRASQTLKPILRQAKPGFGADPDLQKLGEHAQSLAHGLTPPLPEPVVPAAAPSPEVATSAPVEEPEPLPDDELLQALLEEAAEILDAAETTLQQWLSDPQDQSLLNNLRRGMHTLKGGARMAGLKAIGDLSHALESVLETIGRGQLSSSAVPQGLIQQALDRLNVMFEQVREGRRPEAAATLLVELQQLPQEGAAEVSGQTTVVDAAWERAKTAQLREAFVVESSDILQANDLTLRRWRQNTANQELLTDLCRDIQTLRNNARMAGVTSVADVAGSLVALLEAVGSGQIEAGDETIGAIEQSLDGLSQMLDALRQGIVPGKADHLLGLLQNQLQGAKSEQTQVAPSSPRPTLTSAPVVSESIRVDTSLLQSLSNQVGESSIYQSRVEQGVGAFQFNLNELDQTIGRLRLQLRRLEINAEAQILFRREEAGKQHGRDFDPLELDRFSELQHLTRSLMEIVDDLGNVQQTLDNQIYSVNQLLHEQHKVNREVQDSLVRTRMVRFASVVPRLRRVIRQVAGELDKQAELKIDNHDELIDRNVLENMIAPMEHMLRNALDHGIETPEIRRAAGKPETGTITLGIGREGAEIVFELKDDGAGLDFDAIRAKAESRGMLMPGQEVDEAKLVNLLLQPGFSTAKKVTQISGRGVGMDVVNEGIRALRGTLRIRSQAGQGTRFTVRLPFSLEQTQALLVRVKNDVYAVPLLSIEAVDRLAEGELRTYLAGDPVEHSYGENPYPVHGMGVLFGYEPLAFEEVEDPQPPVLLFRSDEAAAALQVDDVLGRAEIVLKAVAPQVGMVPGVAGATVLADGRVAVVLDLAAVVRNMATLEGVDALIPQVQTRTDERPEVLVVDDSITMRKVTSRLLERHDFRVALAKDGLEAVAQLDSTAPPVLVIMDIEMPRMDGFEVLAHIRNQPRLRHLPVIMVTSRSGDKHRSRARQLGASDYLIKPYRDEDLLASIHKVLPEVSPA